MSFPPPPDPFGTQPPAGDGHPGAPPQWGPQHQWAANPQPGPGRGGGKTKWILGGLVVALAIALAVVITVVLVRPDNNSDNTPNDGATDVATSEFASANDTGPITIITKDPTCAAWTPIVNTLAGTSKKNGWSERDPSTPASAWSPGQRGQYQETGKAMRAAADQTTPLISSATHRVMRQLFEQFIAYTRAFTDAIPTYTERDNTLARTATQAGNTLTAICDAITSGSAAARAPLVSAGPAPLNVAPNDARDPKRFLASPNPICSEWVAAADKYESDITDWQRGTDVNIPVDQWTPEQKMLSDNAIPAMRESADALEALGQRSDNPVFQDFAQLAAQYRRAYIQAMPTYSAADRHLYDVGIFPVGMIRRACEGAGE